jgi:ketosteroid isomerase-like protein
MKLPKRAEDAHATLAAAFNTKDMATILSMYDVDGIMCPEPQKSITGKASWEEAITGILAIPGIMEIKTVYCLQTGDIAVGRSEWSITDGDEVKIAAKGIEVMKKQDDGTWKIIVDHAFGAESTLTA